jgi:hypothetical protein
MLEMARPDWSTSDLIGDGVWQSVCWWSLVETKVWLVLLWA